MSPGGSQLIQIYLFRWNFWLLTKGDYFLEQQ